MYIRNIVLVGLPERIKLMRTDKTEGLNFSTEMHKEYRAVLFLELLWNTCYDKSIRITYTTRSSV
jgi:hypothetical protein